MASLRPPTAQKPRRGLRYSAVWYRQMTGPSRLTTSSAHRMKRPGQHDSLQEMERAMTAKAADKMKSDGWKIVDTTGFLHLIGPLWERVVEGSHEYALQTEDKHHNRRGLVQGGVLMTFADRACG